MRRPFAILATAVLLPITAAFSCSLTSSDIPYDLNALSGTKVLSKESQTPPTTSEAKVSMELCGNDGLGPEDGIPDEDKCPPNTRVCLKLLNHKSSASDPDRITAVVPIWLADTPEDDVFTTPMGKTGEQGLKIYVQGPEYAGVRQHLNLTLLCDPSAENTEPEFASYTSGLVSLEWTTKEACPRDQSPSPPGSPAPDSSSGLGFWGFIKFVFWLCVVGLIAYFAIGMFYNHQQYSARGWDLVPHRDFWREVPVLVKDLFSHLVAGFRGQGGGRGGYSSLG
ncbi:hypothetical protein IAU60_006626 [Kwoniella sp. DSM 27419]